MRASSDGPGEDVPMIPTGSISQSQKPQDYDHPSWSRRATVRLPVIVLSIVSLLILAHLSLFDIPWPQINRYIGGEEDTWPSDHDKHEKKPEADAAPTSIVVDKSAIITATSTSMIESSTFTEHLAVESGLPHPHQFDLRREFVVTSKATLREYTFNITHGRGAPDGFEKTMIFINGQSPGPLIEANSGDTIRVYVNNMMANTSTTLHWHGIDQRNTTWMDGVYAVSQCGIPPGESFTYEFQLVDQRGSFWYHAHQSVQYTDGLYGPLIIHDPTEAIPEVDQDKIVLLGDLYHQSAEQLLIDYLGPSPPWGPSKPGLEPKASNIVINGRNGHGCGSSKLRACENGTLYTTSVESFQRARLRLISHSTNVPLYFSIDNHTLEIVEMDGVEIEPITTSRVFINPGQRYSVILTANQTAGNYLMRASTATACFRGREPSRALPEDPGIGLAASAVLSYGGVDVETETIGSPWDINSMLTPGIGSEPWKSDCSDLPFDMPKPKRSLDAYDVGDNNSHYFEYQMSLVSGEMRTLVNKTIYSPLEDDATLWKVPHLDLDTETPRWDFGPNQQVLVSLDNDKGAQIAITSFDKKVHPWHLHIQGQNFQVVGWGDGAYGKGSTTWNFDNPMRRDTVSMIGNDHIVLRLASDNPGLWAFHCHMLWHSEGGMFITLAQQLDKLKDLLDGLEGPDGDSIKGKFCGAESNMRS